MKSEIATFFEAFPDGTVWANTVNGRGYDLVLMGQPGPTLLDVNALTDRLGSPGYGGIRNSLGEVGIRSTMELLATYAGNADTLGDWLADAEINRDRNLRLQYLAGLGVNRYEQDQIYRSMISSVEFPEDLFVGSEADLAWLRGVITG
ncbi:MAG TPA: SAM-dependent methyltransferase, partial [Gemmatimonadetes bacterium]|nr:SAM-dependent methyltransferase [Gemmatimonadota bacterium]